MKEDGLFRVKTAMIMDNLIAEGKAVPMLVVIPNGNVSRPGMSAGGYNDEAMSLFREGLLENVIPSRTHRSFTQRIDIPKFGLPPALGYTLPEL